MWLWVVRTSPLDSGVVTLALNLNKIIFIKIILFKFKSNFSLVNLISLEQQHTVGSQNVCIFTVIFSLTFLSAVVIRLLACLSECDVFNPPNICTSTCDGKRAN